MSRASRAQPFVSSRDHLIWLSPLPQTLKELHLASNLSVFACLLAAAQNKHRCTIAELPATTRTDLANRLLPLLDTYREVGARAAVAGVVAVLPSQRHCSTPLPSRQVWLARNRPGGLMDSCARLEHALNCLLR
jgi:hypothetical protein